MLGLLAKGRARTIGVGLLAKGRAKGRARTIVLARGRARTMGVGLGLVMGARARD